jgi:SNF2 family DNA or RNA helicase
VIIHSPQAGDVGLTLTAANHVVHLSRWRNPAVEDQCTGRALRTGQTRPVQVHVPMATLSDGRRSFEQNLHALLKRKRRLLRKTLMPSEPTEGDYEALLEATVG